MRRLPFGVAISVQSGHYALYRVSAARRVRERVGRAARLGLIASLGAGQRGANGSGGSAVSHFFVSSCAWGLRRKAMLSVYAHGGGALRAADSLGSSRSEKCVSPAAKVDNSARELLGVRAPRMTNTG